ncbi:NTP transferase domain-containing protein [Candidatus Microgenomates bacterium]|nr:NTP transferase domain-containing protein [Candidatus Microgenomates bacterium]
MKLVGMILAGGMGKRMQSDLPKVLHEIKDKPMIYYSLKLLSQLPIDDIQVIVGYQKDIVKKAVKDIARQLQIASKIHFASQPEPLGTGHAVRCGLKKVADDTTDVLVLNGDDSAFYSPETIKAVLNLHTSINSDLTFVTLKVDNPIGLGRILRNEGGEVMAIIEDKAATSEQKLINEVNDGCYIFRYYYLKRYINSIKKSSTGEYYLTDLVGIGVKNEAKISTFMLDKRHEWVGVNTQEDLLEANNLAKNNGNFQNFKTQ